MGVAPVIFMGVPRQFTRGYTLEVLRQLQPARVVIPCVGAFALASTVAEAGIPASAIEACDIALYTSVLGAYLAGRPFTVRAKGDLAWLNVYMTDAPGQVAAVALGIRILQFRAKRQSIYMREQVRELVARQEIYIAQLRAAALRMHAKLGGLAYQAEDLWALLARHVPDPQTGLYPPGATPESTLVLCNPPRYTGGYAKQYQGVDEAFEWERPNVRQFDEAQYAPLLRYLAGGPTTLVYYATSVATAKDPAPQWGPPWRSVFAHRPKTGKQAAINWIVANRDPLVKAKLQRGDVEAPVRAKYKLFEGEVTPQTDLRVLPEKKEVASYYRDLLVHNLPMANAERYKVLLADGELLATIGLHLQNLRAGGSMAGVAKLRFAFSVPNPHHRHLHKLTLLSVVSSWFWADEIGDLEDPPRAVQTTMLTPYAEAKTARGIFRLTGRERDEATGMFKLTYYADVATRTVEETKRLFFARWGERDASARRGR